MSSATSRKVTHATLSGLYLITPDDWKSEDLLKVTESIVSEVPCIVQFRQKKRLSSEYYELALRLGEICRQNQCTYIINDNAELASAVGADGVHLGRDDMSITTARQHIGEQGLIGISCYADLQSATQAIQQGADYIAFGSMFVSSTKPEAVVCPLEVLEAGSQLGKSTVAIGGITPDNARSVLAAGADMLAVISGVFSAASPLVAAKRLHSVISQY